MVTIKRYANRKLYNTHKKRYVTLTGIAELVRDGEEVQVIDHETGEDITASTLAQIMFEREKDGRSSLPRTMLTRIIQASGERVLTLKRALTTPQEFARLVDGEIQRRIEILVREEMLSETEGAYWAETLLALSESVEPEPWLEEMLEHALQMRGVPTRKEINSLSAQLESLTRELDRLDQGDT